MAGVERAGWFAGKVVRSRRWRRGGGRHIRQASFGRLGISGSRPIRFAALHAAVVNAIDRRVVQVSCWKRTFHQFFARNSQSSIKY
jgi:hypothetical protein